MLRGRKKCYAFGLLTSLVLGMGLLVGPNVYATGTRENTELESVDMSKGVEYIYAEGNSVSPAGINLNGNSVIIVESANSSSSMKYYNMYIDKDMDGEIDSDENTMVEVEGSTDIKVVSGIYGVMSAKTERPISITLKSGYVPIVYGVYQGAMVVDSAKWTGVQSAININVEEGFAAGYCGAKESTIVSTGMPAVTMSIKSEEATGNWYGVADSDVTVTDAAAIDILVDTESTSSITVIGVYNGTLSVKNADTPGVTATVKNGKVGQLNGLNNATYTLEKSDAAAVHANIQGGSISGLYTVSGGSVTSDGTYHTLVDVDLSDGTVSAVYGCNLADLNAGNSTNIAIDMDLTGNAVVTGAAYGVQGLYSAIDEKTASQIVGVVDINLVPSTLSDNNSSCVYGVYGSACVEGDVNLYLDNMKTSAIFVLYSNVVVNGNVNYTKGENTYNSGGHALLYNSRVVGDVDVSMYGENQSTTSNMMAFQNMGQASQYVIDGDYHFEYLGGKVASLYVTQDYTNSYKATISGDVDIDINGGEISSLYGLYYMNTLGDYSCDVGGDSKSVVLKTSLQAANNALVKGTAKINVYNNNTSSNMVYAEGLCNTTVEGQTDVVFEGGYYDYIRGISSNGGTVAYSIMDNANVTIKNVNTGGETVSYLYSESYGVSAVHVEGKTTVNIQNSLLGSVFGVRGCSNYTHTGVIEVNFNQVEAKGYYACGVYNLYGATNAIQCTLNDVTSGDYIYGAHFNSGGYEGTIAVNINGATAEDDIYGLYTGTATVKTNPSVSVTNATTNRLCGISGNNYPYSTVENDAVITIQKPIVNYLYMTNCLNVSGDLVANLHGGVVGSTKSSGTAMYGVYYTNVIGDTSINVGPTQEIEDRTKIYSSCYFYYVSDSSATGYGDVNIEIKSTDFLNGAYSSGTISNWTCNNMTLNMAIDDDSTVAPDITISPTEASYGIGIAEYNGHIYYAGNVVFDKNVEANDLHFVRGNFTIPEGIVISANTLHFQTYSNFIVDGTLSGTPSGGTNENGQVTTPSIYVVNGKISNNADKYANLYYLIEFDYSDNEGAISSSINMNTNYLLPGKMFGCAGKTVTFIATPVKGYHIKGASATFDGDDTAHDVTFADNKGSFNMGYSKTKVTVSFEGDPIMVGKTVADPVAKLNNSYTANTPLYDLSTLTISGDTANGTVSYALAKDSQLPEGLQLIDGKIYGTPTVAYESGKEVVVEVTGKNGAKADVTLNIVVTEGEGTQTSQEGRIIADETNDIVYLFGNSVIIDEKEGQTAIYLDDNKDGKADYTNPAFVGDLTNATVYGVYDTTTDKQAKIVINGGTIGTIYGAYLSTITAEGDGVDIRMNGGSVGYLYGMYDSTVQGTLRVDVTDDATITNTPSIVAGTTKNYAGYLYNNKGQYNVYKNYNLTEHIDAGDLIVNKDAVLTINKGVSVSAANVLTGASTSYIELKGELDADYFSGSGCILMICGPSKLVSHVAL